MSVVCANNSTSKALNRCDVMSLPHESNLSKMEDDDSKIGNRRASGTDDENLTRKSTADRDPTDFYEAISVDSGKGRIPIGDSRIALVEDINTAGVPPKECWSARYSLGLMGLLGAACVYAMRVNLSVAIVAMVKPQLKNDTNTSDVDQVCLPPEGQNDTSQDGQETGDFEWSKATQGVILSVFYYGYLLTNLVGGRAAEYFGGKLVFGWGVVLTAIFTVLSPLCAQVSTGLFIAVRICEGLSEGVIFPSMNALLAKWIPPLERPRYSSLVFAGAQFGTIITMPVSGWLCDTDFLGGWPSVFYVFGGLGIIWGVAWYFLVYSHPDMHPRISREEKAYINYHCGALAQNVIPIPWKAVFTSLPFWAVMVAHVGYNWGFYTLLSELPTYLKNIQHFSMTSNGIYSALPYLVMWIVSLIYSNIINYLQGRDKMSTITVRRLSMGIGMYGPMLGLVAMCFVDCDPVLAMVFLCIAVGICGPIYSGYMCSHQDLSPNLAGTLLGFTNAAGTIPGIVAPSITGLIINGNQTLWAWRTVFIISAVVYFVTGTFYVTFISAEVQPWNAPQEDKGKGKKRY
ncbi:putative inorganic phosphate cotransporter isoform X1 [Macrobrachium rosenbergii]|uniref:putative inorganic phosphate cotransporter isoform X1 n=2 Tax=Macrobrachium rosenbergii TaxID=79674 RepID=UPI0034D4400D